MNMNESTGSGSASQQLGAAPGTREGVPGNGNELEEMEFASSNEAEFAPRDGVGVGIPDYDEELDGDTLDAIRDANTNFAPITVTITGTETGVTDRDYDRAYEGEMMQEAVTAQGDAAWSIFSLHLRPRLGLKCKAVTAKVTAA